MDNFALKFQDITGISPNEIPLYIILTIMFVFSIYLWKNEK